MVSCHSLVKTYEAKVLEPYKLFLVDDEPAVLRALELLLKSIKDFELDITSTTDSATAKNMIKSGEPIDILMTDLRMTPVDGFELIRTLKSSGSPAKIIMVSAYINEELIEEMKRLGCDSFVRKPFKRDELLECLRQILPLEN